MAISFNDFIKKAGGTAQDVQLATGDSPAVAKARADATAAEADAAKANNPLEIAKQTALGVGKTLVSDVVETGKNLGESAAAGDVTKNVTEGNNGVQDTALRVLKQIKADKDAGKDTSHLEQAYNNIAGHTQETDVKNILPTLNKSNFQAVLEAVGAGSTIFSGDAVEAGIAGAKGVVKAASDLSHLTSDLGAHLKSITGKLPLIGNAVKPGTSVEEVARLADAAQKVQSTSDAVMAGKAPTSALKTAADAAGAPVTFTEKLAGLAPDVKARIKGKGPLLADYLNVTDARNASDLVPTPLEYGASFATKAKSQMETLLSNTGSTIGKFRSKIATYTAPRDAFNGIRDEFSAQLGKLNLAIKNGKIATIPGKIAQTVSDAEVTSLQKLYEDLNTASQNPSLENIIDLRNKFDNKINFDKAARDVSSSLDPLSRAVRKKAAATAEQIVGKSQASSLHAYSQFMDAYNDLKSYTDRNAGAEFLLKRVFSERGADPRAVMATIKQYTGIDLMDHAMMAKIATELGGNAATQGLFRQEITRAGLDVANLLKGNPVGAVDTLVKKGMDKLVNQRKVFEKAAQ